MWCSIPPAALQGAQPLEDECPSVGMRWFPRTSSPRFSCVEPYGLLQPPALRLHTNPNTFRKACTRNTCLKWQHSFQQGMEGNWCNLPVKPMETQAPGAGSLKGFELLVLMASMGGFFSSKNWISFIDLKWNVSVCSLRFLLKDLNNLKGSSSAPTSPGDFIQTSRPPKAQFWPSRLPLIPSPSLLHKFPEHLAISRHLYCAGAHEAPPEPSHHSLTARQPLLTLNQQHKSQHSLNSASALGWILLGFPLHRLWG